MKITTSLYSRDWGLPEEESFHIPPRDPIFVDLTELCVPLEGCTVVPIGSLNQSIIAKLESSGFDQAPVEVPTSALGWRLVATAQLKTLLQAERPLTLDDENFLDADTLGFESFNRTVHLEELIVGMKSRRAALVFTKSMSRRLDPPDDVEAEHCNRIVYGLATLADLNKQAVRAAIYDRFARLEVTIARLVAESFSKPEDWIRKLNEDTQVRILGFQALAKSRGMDPHPVEAATLVDLIRIVAKSPELLLPLDYVSRKRFDQDTGKIADIRNRVMHPVRPLVLSSKDIDLLATTLQTLSDLQRRIEKALDERVSREFR